MGGGVRSFIGTELNSPEVAVWVGVGGGGPNALAHLNSRPSSQLL